MTQGWWPRSPTWWISGLWPQGTRMLVRREEPHPGAQLTFSDIDGHRYQLFITDHPEDDVAFLEALYRGRGRCERRICDAKDTGLENLPSASFAINEAWLALVLIASDLLAWMRGLCLEGALQKAEPKRLRYTLLHSAGSSCARRAGPPCASRRAGRGPTTSSPRSPDSPDGPQHPAKHPPPLQPRPPPPHRWCTTPVNPPPRTHQTIRSPTTTFPTPSQARTTTTPDRQARDTSREALLQNPG